MTLQVTSMSVSAGAICHRLQQGWNFTVHALITSPLCYFLPSFLALWHIDSFPSPFLDSLLFPSSGASSQWGKGEAADGDGGLSLSLNPPGVQISLSCACPSSASHTAQPRLLIFLCSLCLPVAYVDCLSFYTNPKLPGAKHNEFPGTTNVGAHVDCWDANKITAVISIWCLESSASFPPNTEANAG